MTTLAFVVALAMTGGVAGAAPYPRSAGGVTIASSGDQSPGPLDAHTRRRHGEIVRLALLDVLHRSGANVPHRVRRQLDAAIVAWRVVPTSIRMAVSAELRIVLCDDHGKILSIVTGRASVSAPRGTRLAELREQALSEAIFGMTRTLQSQLDRATS